MKKTILALVAVLVMITNTVFANSIYSDYTTFGAARLQNAFPHTVSKDGSLIIEGKLTATDYASILLALSGIQNNDNDLKKKISGTYTSYILTSEFLFMKPDGSVISTYDYADGKFVPNNKLDIASAAQMGIAFNDALVNIGRFNANSWYNARVKEAATRHTENTSRFVMNNLYKQGKFFDDAKQDKVDYKTMGNGLLSYYTLWNLKKNTDMRESLISTGKEIYDFLESSWSREHNVFAFNEDASVVKFDIRDFGLLLWGSKELSEVLAQGGFGYEAVNLMTYTSRMLDRVLVEGVTIREEGIVREIEVNNGAVSAMKDEINTGRLYVFLYGFTKWNESFFTKLTGSEAKNLKLIKDMILYSVNNHIDEYGIVHDTKFSNPSIKNDAKETPYLTWYMTSADYMLESYKNLFTANETILVEKSIKKNYEFLMNNIYTSGKEMNEKSGF